MSSVCLLATLSYAAPNASRIRELSVVAVPKVRDPINSAVVLVRDGAILRLGTLDCETEANALLSLILRTLCAI